MDNFQMTSLVHRTRINEYGNWYDAIRNAPLVYCELDDNRHFLSVDITVIIDEDMHRIIGWRHPYSISLVKAGPVNTFIDCTFRIVPQNFYQCMILMIYSEVRKTYVPIFYILLQFVEAISEVSNDFVVKLEQIKKKRIRPNDHKDVIIHVIPDNYLEFIV